MSAIDWNQLTTLIGLVGIISGRVSAGINYVIEYRKEKEKRGAEEAKEQIELYSAFIYNLGILMATWRSSYDTISSKDNTEMEVAKQKIKAIADNKNEEFLLTLVAVNPSIHLSIYTYLSSWGLSKPKIVINFISIISSCCIYPSP